MPRGKEQHTRWCEGTHNNKASIHKFLKMLCLLTALRREMVLAIQWKHSPGKHDRLHQLWQLPQSSSRQRETLTAVCNCLFQSFHNWQIWVLSALYWVCIGLFKAEHFLDKVSDEGEVMLIEKWVITFRTVFFRNQSKVLIFGMSICWALGWPSTEYKWKLNINDDHKLQGFHFYVSVNSFLAGQGNAQDFPTLIYLCQPSLVFNSACCLFSVLSNKWHFTYFCHLTFETCLYCGMTLHGF